MPTIRLRRGIALITAAAVLASMTVATVATPASAAKPKCQGKTATIVGTRKGERIVGTPRRDVIVAKGGNDRIFGRGGNDLICAGAGNDRLVGNAGIDKLIAGAGADKLFGGAGPDRLFGGPGPDVIAGQPGNDVIDGGVGVDTCYQGLGSGPVVRCERPVAPVIPTGPTLHSLAGILAVAYSDVDGLPGYSTGDVLIAKLVDANGDSVPSVGDRVEMGRYPTNLAGTTFGDWGVKIHTVMSADLSANPGVVRVQGSPGHDHEWLDTGYEYYWEDPDGTTEDSYVYDLHGAGEEDELKYRTGTQSQPMVDLNVEAPGTGDDRFIDIEIYAP